MQFVSGVYKDVKCFFNSPQDEISDLLFKIKCQAKNNECSKLVSSLNKLCGKTGHIEISTCKDNFQILFFFDSAKQLQVFQKVLVKRFEKYSIASTILQNDSRDTPLLLELSPDQSAALLGINPNYTANFKDSQKILMAIKEQLQPIEQQYCFPVTDLCQEIANYIFILSPIGSMFCYSMANKHAFKYINENEDLWVSIAKVNNITWDFNSKIPPELKVKRFIIMQNAKLYEKKSEFSFDDFQVNSDNNQLAIKYYCEAALLGEPNARLWLEEKIPTLTLVDYLSEGKIWLTLAHIYSRENADIKLINECYEKSYEALMIGAGLGSPTAILTLYENTFGEKSAEETKKYLDCLLAEQLNVCADPLNSKCDRTWILSVFAKGTKLPPSYEAMREKALNFINDNSKHLSVRHVLKKLW